MKRTIFNLLFSGYLLFFILIGEIPDVQFHVYFFDVGQGDSIFMITPDNNKILVDGGPQNNVLENLGDAMPFFSREIDLIILTHPHSDHLDGLLEVIKRYEVRSVLITGIQFESSVYEEFLNILGEKNIPVYIANEDTDFKFGEVVLDVLFPFAPLAGREIEEANNSSIVINVEYKKHSILLTGDLEAEAEKMLLMGTEQFDTEILKVGHHGSKTSSSSPFIKSIHPETAVISVGEGNTFGHPDKETLDTLKEAQIKIYRTDEDGTIEFVF